MENKTEIEEAVIVEESKLSDADLMARLNVATEPKEPTVSTGNAWNFNDDKEPEAIKPEVKDTNFTLEDKKPTDQPTPSATTTPATTNESTEPKISKDLKMASARITVSALDSTQRVIFQPLINRKFAKKFNAEEVIRLDETNIIDAEKTLLQPEDLTLRTKFDRLMKRRDKILKDIPFTDVESQDLEKIFYQYMDAKNTTLPPELMLIIGISNVIGKRAIDLMVD